MGRNISATMKNYMQQYKILDDTVYLSKKVYIFNK